ncbi:uncharacterized protein LOC144659695 [Oculina patagonica]
MRLISLQKILYLVLVGIMLSGFNYASQLEIQAFQPTVVPIRAITTLTLKTNGELNVTSNSSLQCRFKDISVPARMEDGFILCDTPPMKNIDRVSVHLDVDGKLFKTKKPLYFHEPFKVSNITPSVVSPAQNVHLNVSGISCKDWMQYFVRFQTANGTKKTQQGICKDSIVSCYVPEFPPNTRLRVGLTLSNRLVQWADKKVLIQYPIDAIRSSVKDVQTDITKKGSFTFRVAPKDRFQNPIGVAEKDNRKSAKISVQYSSHDQPESLKFLQCSTTPSSNADGDVYVLNCTGAEKERILFYPSINNVPLGGQDKYEARTTLCPGKSSCEVIYAVDHKSTSRLALLLVCGGVALLVIVVVAVLCFVRYRSGWYAVEKKRRKAERVERARAEQLEMEVEQRGNDSTDDPTLQRYKSLPAYSAFYPQLHHHHQSAAIQPNFEGKKPGSHIQQNDDLVSNGDSPELNLGSSGSHSERACGKQTDELEKESGTDRHVSGEDGENDDQPKEKH